VRNFLRIEATNLHIQVAKKTLKQVSIKTKIPKVFSQFKKQIIRIN